MAEKQKGSKGGARVGPIRLKRKDERSFKTARVGGKAQAGRTGGKTTTGRVRVRRNEAAYARAAEAQSQRVQSEIQAAVDAASRIREQIEAKIERRFKENRTGNRAESRAGAPGEERTEPVNAGKIRGKRAQSRKH